MTEVCEAERNWRVQTLRSVFVFFVLLNTCLTGTLEYKCDPPRENRQKGDGTGTRAMTRHAKRDI